MTLSTVTTQSKLSSLQQLHKNATVSHLKTSVQFICACMYLLGQSVLLQGCVSIASPMHPLPFFCGGGLLHRRTRVTLPSPHVVVHADQGDQRPQFPSARTTPAHADWKTANQDRTPLQLHTVYTLTELKQRVLNYDRNL